MTIFIPYGRQSISQEDIAEVNKVLMSDWITQGPTIDAFEKAVAIYCHSKYTVAVSSATAALHLACLALDLGPGDCLWTSPNTFVASANCALYCGAKIDFVDIDPDTYNLSADALEEKLKLAKKEGTLPKIVVPVHFAGQSCEMNKIKQLSHQYGFKIIEDASHAIGGDYKGEKIGSCQFSDIVVFSFHPVKIITTGEGGMLTTNDSNLYEKLQRLRTHGISRKSNQMTGESDGPWYYQQIDLGFNYRITDFQAALGFSQLKRLDEYVKLRREFAHRYNQYLSGLPLVVPFQHKDTNSSWHLYVVMLELEKLKNSRLKIFEAMRTANIGVNVHYIPVHTQPYYKKIGFAGKKFVEAENYYDRALTLPLFPTMTYAEQDKVINTLKSNLI